MIGILLAASLTNPLIEANQIMTEVEQIEIWQCQSDPKDCNRLAKDAEFMADSISKQNRGK